MLSARETPPPPATSKPTKGKKVKEKAKAAGKKKKKIISMLHDSPAMGTRRRPLRIKALPHILEAKESFHFRA
jgi:hypothetical protein